MYLTEFASKKDMEDKFECEIPDDIQILIAWYGYGSYCGNCFVLFKKDGKLYEVNASHCSCNGIEGQWSPEETTVATLRMRRFDNGECDGNEEFVKTLGPILDKLESEGFK